MKKLIFIILLTNNITLMSAQVWTALAIQPNDGNQCLLTDTVNNFLYVGGQFTSVGTMPASHIARWDGTNWDTLGAGLNNLVNCMAIYNNELYAGGYFTASDTTPVSYIGKWNGNSWEPVGGGCNNIVWSLAVFNNELYAGGLFTQVGGNPANYIAKWNGTIWTSCGSGTNAVIACLCSSNNELYVGGNFTSAGGNTCNYIASWDGINWSPLGGGLDNVVNSIVVFNNEIYAAGGFVNAGGTVANHIAEWNGNQWSALDSGLNSYCRNLCVYNYELYCTGSFSAAGTVTTDKIARWNGYGWNSVGSCSGIKRALSVYTGDLYVFGSSLLGSSANHLVKWNTPPPPPPIASFSANGTLIQAGSFVKFSTQIADSSMTYQWDFPGGIPSSSVAKRPVVNYLGAGVYDVKLIVANASGTDTLIKTSYITVDNLNHPIDTSTTTDYAQFLYDHVYYIDAGGTTELDTCAYGIAEVYYYKPSDYDSLNSPILWAVHGLGADGSIPVLDLIDIAERRHALIVSVTMTPAWYYGYTYSDIPVLGGSAANEYFGWYQSIFKTIYKHVLQRENRDSIPLYLIGFSAGGQFVSRYMLVRQAIPDSIPIRMAVSTNGYNYTLCTDTFQNFAMPFPCGLYPGMTTEFEKLHLNCNERIVQYYNENYGVLIGTGDTQTSYLWSCDSVTGINRYERAKNFHAFSDSNAIARGTTLKWPYVEIPGVGHNETLMYNTKASPTDSSSIAETLLFDTPYQTVPSLAPIASFNADSILVNINGTVNFINSSINASSYQWDFGDGNSSTLTNPSHVYTSYGTYSVSLGVNNLTSCENKTTKKCYITVTNAVAVNEITSSDMNLKVYPNPVSDFLSLEVNSKTEKNLSLVLYNLLGVEQKQFSFSKSTQLSVKDFTTGIYIYKIIDRDKMIGVGKIIKN